MSVGIGSDIIEPDVAAAEFMLGLLDDEEALAFGDAAVRDPALAEAVTAWSERLAPLSALVAPVAPTPGLWLRIAAELGTAPVAPAVPTTEPVAPTFPVVGLPASAPIVSTSISATPVPVVPARRRRSSMRLRVAGLAALAVAACVAGVLLVFGDTIGGLFGKSGPPITEVSAVPPPRALHPVTVSIRLAPVAPPTPLLPPIDRTVLLDPPGTARAGSGAARPQMRASVLGSFLLRIDVVRPLTVAPGTELGVWVQPRSEKTPSMIGRIGPGGDTLDLPDVLGDGTLTMVTAEPADRPSRNRPGPILLQGRFGQGGG